MSCRNCDGQPFVIDSAVAEALAALNGPRRRDARRTNQWGGKGIIKFNPTADETNQGIRQQITLVDWQSLDGEPHAVTVDFGRISSGGAGTFPAGSNAAGNLSYRANVEVLVGTPATTAEPFYADLNRGQRFTVTTSYIGVTAQMLTPQSGYVSGSLAVTGQIGLGTAPSLAPVLVTAYVDDLFVAATSAPIIIPPRANVLLPFRGNVLGNTWTIVIRDNFGATVDTFTNVTMPADGVTLPGTAYDILLTNTGATSAFYALMFQLNV